VTTVRGMIDVLQQRYEVRGRKFRGEEGAANEPDTEPYEQKAAPEQAAFAFESTIADRSSRLATSD
jgi:hypothetical protein